MTLGLFWLVVNGLMLWLTAALSGALGLGFEVRGFWAAVLGALVVSVASWILDRLVAGPDRPAPRPGEAGDRPAPSPLVDSGACERPLHALLSRDLKVSFGGLQGTVVTDFADRPLPDGGARAAARMSDLLRALGRSPAVAMGR